MAKQGVLLAGERGIRQDRRIWLCQARATDTDGRLPIHGAFKLMVLQNRQSVHDVLRNMEIPVLPSKFLNG